MCGACECNQDYGGKQCQQCLELEVSGLAGWSVAVKWPVHCTAREELGRMDCFV